MKNFKSPLLIGLLAMACISGANAADPLNTSSTKRDVSGQRLDANKVNTARPQVQSPKQDAKKFPGDQFNKFPGDQFNKFPGDQFDSKKDGK